MMTFLQENINRNYSYQRVLLHINKVNTGKGTDNLDNGVRSTPKRFFFYLVFTCLNRT